MKEKVFIGPTYEEMLYPHKIDREILNKFNEISDEFNPLNLYNINWRNHNGEISKIVLTKDITGVDANIVVLLGTYFPSGSHKVGPAYTSIMEKCIDQELNYSEDTVVVPSSGNFGIGISYVGKLLNIKSRVMMPIEMSEERVSHIKKYGGELDLVKNTNGDMTALIKKCIRLGKENNYKVLNQFELFSNYRFHRYVTGNSMIEACKNVGNGKIAAYCAGVGSGGTIAAGDEIKKMYKDAKVVALEPKDCSILSPIASNKKHQIEGIGDLIVPLILNISNIDYVAQISDKDCIEGLKEIQKSNDNILRNILGVSSICNILGAIKIAKYLHLGKDDNVVTVATDGIDRYYSVLDRSGNDIEQKVSTFKTQTDSDVFDISKADSKEKLYKLKEQEWVEFGYTKSYLDLMKNMSFWDNEYLKIKEYDKKFLLLKD